jgi:hypothetical protein
MGTRHAEPRPAAIPRGSTISEACAEVGRALAIEPWLDRYPVCVVATPTRSSGRWMLTDHTGSLPFVEAATGIATLLASSAGKLVTLTAEWTPNGIVPLTIHLADRAVDVGPVADPSFVGAA